MTYYDYMLTPDDSGKATTYSGVDAVILAIRNIILSRPGNYPLTPGLGMDIAKYEFDLLDKDTLSTIKSELNKQINKYIPTIDNVEVNVSKVEDTDASGNLVNGIGISVGLSLDGDTLTANYLVIQDKSEIKIYNEVLH